MRDGAAAAKTRTQRAVDARWTRLAIPLAVLAAGIARQYLELARRLLAEKQASPPRL